MEVMFSKEENDHDISLFGRSSNSPIWTYDGGSEAKAVSISKDGKYILVGYGGGGGSGYKTLLFSNNNSNNPIWSYTTSDHLNSVSISSDGKYGVVAGNEDTVYLFKNSLAERPFLLTYSPYNGRNTETDQQLGWFASSDDRANLDIRCLS